MDEMDDEQARFRRLAQWLNHGYIEWIKDRYSRWPGTVRLVEEMKNIYENPTVAPNLPITNTSNNTPRAPLWFGSLDMMKPSVVSIGPYHINLDNPLVPKMQIYKVFSIRNIFKEEDHIVKCLEYLVNHKDFLKSCYEGYYDIPMVFPDSNLYDFVLVMLLDGCFIVSLLLSATEHVFPWYVALEREVGPSRMVEILEDLLLMENQIPLLVLKAIIRTWSIDVSSSNQSLLRYNDFPFLSRAQSYSRYQDDFDRWSFIYHYLFKSGVREDNEEFDNLLHLYYKSFVGDPRGLAKKNHKLSIILSCCGDDMWPGCCTSQEESSKNKRVKYVLHSATNLKECGVVLKEKLSESGEEIAITFAKGTLKIPCFVIDKITMNILACEQAKYYNKMTLDTPISKVVHFIASMIRTSNDLELLMDSRIVEPSGRSIKETMDLFAVLKGNLKLNNDENYLVDVCKNINEFVHSRRNKWWIKLKRDYFSTPWSVLSLFAAIFLLVLTSLQTYFTIYAYYHPPK